MVINEVSTSLDSLENTELGLGQVTMSYRRDVLEIPFTLSNGTQTSVKIETGITCTPGEWYIDSKGVRNRRYGGIYEKIEVKLLFGTQYHMLRDYGRYNRQIIGGLCHWVRIDTNDDFLGIDGTVIQQIKPIIPDRTIIIRHIFDPLTIHFNLQGDMMDYLPPNPPVLKRQVTSEGKLYSFEILGIQIKCSVNITPGEWYQDETGRWSRRYGGQYEVMDFTMINPDDRDDLSQMFERDHFIRAYGAYTREQDIVSGQWKWIRTDDREDYLGIDDTVIQQIQAVVDPTFI